jgi:hypothetical protein
MPCPVIANSQRFAPVAPPAGSGDIIFGNSIPTTYVYDGMMNYYWEYNYGVLFISAAQMSAAGVPNGANITSLNFHVDNYSTGTYPENQIEVYMAEMPTTFSQLPLNLRVNLTSVTDTAWNLAVNPVQIASSINSTYVQASGDPQRNFNPVLTFPVGFTYTAGKNLIISLNSKSGVYVYGTSSNPRWVGQTLAGSQPRLFCSDYRASGGVYPSTHVVNYNATFRPNIRINWS